MKTATKQNAAKIYDRLVKQYPDARCTLDFKNPRELLVATILAAQCTDERVNVVTKGLFKKYPKASDYAKADPAELEEDIRSTGFFRNKAKAIISASRDLVEKHGGEVPGDMDELVSLAGVGRKTANVVLGSAFDKPAIIVDTHFSRVSARLGLTEQKDPVKIESDLMKLLPPSRWTLFSHLMVFHGRNTCKARKPACDRCAVSDLCRYFSEEGG